jgi:hypothetical protein
VKNGTNNKGNLTYKQDDARFLLANFHHILHMSLMNLFFFLHKFSKCFFGMNQRHHGGKLCLGGSPKVVRLWTLMIDTQGVVSRLEAPLKFLDLNSGRALVGAIKLNREEIVLIVQPLQAKLKIDDGT